MDDILYPKWTKILDLSKEIPIEEFQLSNYFHHVANIVESISVKRQTVIEFVPVIPREDWKKETTEWIYIFTIDNCIVKIGGTRTGLAGRASSYLCGHHIPERGKSRDCSKTNGFIYNTFDYYIRKGHTVKMWGFRIEPVTVNVNIWGETKDILPQIYTAFETNALEKYKTQTGHYPSLNDNSDPSHRTKKKSKISPEK